MGLTFSARVAARGFDVDLELGDHERLAVLGPNGAGKSTLLGVLAGTVRPDAGHAELDGEPLFDLRSGRWPAPHRRRVGLLTQDPLLFPHLDVLANVAFGPRAAGVPRRTAAAAAHAHGSRPSRRTTSRRAGRTRCPAARRSGWRWPARWPPTRGCCCSTSRWRPWT